MANQDCGSRFVGQTPLGWAGLATRWTARLTGALLLGLVVALFIGEGLLGGGGPNLVKASWPERFMFVAMLISVAGLVVLWWRELLGGVFVIGGMVVFYGLNYHLSGKFPGGAFPLLYMPGILAVVSWVLSRPGFQGKPPA
jgi:hypothetical protein